MKAVDAVLFAYSGDATNRYSRVDVDFSQDHDWRIAINGTDGSGDPVYPNFLAVDNYSNTDPVTVVIDGIETGVGPYTKSVWEISRFTHEILLSAISDQLVRVWISERKLPIGEGVNQFGTSSMTSKFGATPVENFGGKGDGATDDLTAINAGIVALNAAGGGQLLFTSPHAYVANGQINLLSNVELLGFGASIVGNGLRVLVNDGTVNCNIRGITGVGTSGLDADFLFDIRTLGFVLEETNWKKVPDTGGYIGYLRQTSSYGYIKGFRCSGANGVFLAGHDHRISDFDMSASAGGDDCWAVKAPISQTYNIVIENGIARGFAAVVSFGSEIGAAGANDASYQYYVRNISIDNVIGDRCTAFTYIKPGAVAADYRDGTLQDIFYSNCQLNDETGQISRRFGNITVGRGARVWNIHFNQCGGRFRCPDRSSGQNGGVRFYLLDYAGGTAPAEIDGVYFNDFSVIDPLGGIAPGGAITSYPIDHAVVIDRQNTGGPVPLLKRVELDNLRLNGCARAAVDISGLMTASPGPIILRSPRLINYAGGVLASADNAAISNNGMSVNVTNLEASPSAFAAATTRGVMGDGQADKTVPIIDPNGQTQIELGDVAAATTIHRSYAATRDQWISRIDFVNRAAIAASAVDKVTITVDNKDTAANLTTKDSNTGFAVAANTPVSINGATQFTAANAYLHKGKILDITIATAGATVLAGASLIIYSVSYGRI